MRANGLATVKIGDEVIGQIDGEEVTFTQPDSPRVFHFVSKDHGGGLYLADWIRHGPGWRGALGGFCPRWAEGFVDGFFWFFRARGQRWQFCVGSGPLVDAENELYDESPGAFILTGSYGTEQFAAGWMPDDDAWALIERGFAAWRAAKRVEEERVVGVWEGEGGRGGEEADDRA